MKDLSILFLLISLRQYYALESQFKYFVKSESDYNCGSQNSANGYLPTTNPGFCFKPQNSDIVQNCVKYYYTSEAADIFSPLCHTCATGFAVNTISYKCQNQISNCLQYTFSQTLAFCQQCESGYRQTDDNYTCLPEITNCQTYAPSYRFSRRFQCTACQQNYLLSVDRGKCFKKSVLCIFYHQARMTDTHAQCLKCYRKDQKYIVSKDKSECVPEIQKCITYSSEYGNTFWQKCSSCSEGYHTTDDALKCLKLIDNCQEYYKSYQFTQELQCLNCPVDYLKADDNKKCYQLIEYCETYDQTEIANGKYICQQCFSGYVLKVKGGRNECFTEIPNCLEYEDVTLQTNFLLCKTCQSDYIKSDDQYICYKIIPFCSQYSSFTLSNFDLTCLACDSINNDYVLGYQGRMCLQKIHNCDENVLSVDQKSLTCNKCHLGYIKHQETINGQQTDICVKSIDNCEDNQIYKGSFPNIFYECTQCNSGFSTNTNKWPRCIKYIDNCETNTIIQDGNFYKIQCDQCKEGYYLQSDKSKQDSCLRIIPNCQNYQLSTTNSIDFLTCSGSCVNDNFELTTNTIDNLNINTCLQRIENCQTHITNGSFPTYFFNCSQCESNYQKGIEDETAQKNYICLEQIDNCVTQAPLSQSGTYPNFLKCSSCMSTYQLSTDTILCLKTIENCITNTESGSYPSAILQCSLCKQFYQNNTLTIQPSDVDPLKTAYQFCYTVVDFCLNTLVTANEPFYHYQCQAPTYNHFMTTEEPKLVFHNHHFCAQETSYTFANSIYSTQCQLSDGKCSVNYSPFTKLQEQLCLRNVINCSTQQLMEQVEATNSLDIDPFILSYTKCTQCSQPLYEQNFLVNTHKICMRLIDNCQNNQLLNTDINGSTYYYYTCLQCSTYYQKVVDDSIINTCQQAIDFCETYENKTVAETGQKYLSCTKCLNSSYFLQNISITSESISFERQMCFISIRNCLEYEKVGTYPLVSFSCKTCKSGYIKGRSDSNTNYACLLILDNCANGQNTAQNGSLEFIGYTQCQGCNLDYYLFNDDNLKQSLCMLKPSNCKNDLFTVDKASTFPLFSLKCDTCQDTYYTLDQNDIYLQCKKVIPQDACTNYIDQTGTVMTIDQKQCDTCKDNFQLFSNYYLCLENKHFCQTNDYAQNQTSKYFYSYCNQCGQFYQLVQDNADNEKQFCARQTNYCKTYEVDDLIYPSQQLRCSVCEDQFERKIDSIQICLRKYINNCSTMSNLSTNSVSDPKDYTYSCSLCDSEYTLDENQYVDRMEACIKKTPYCSSHQSKAKTIDYFTDAVNYVSCDQCEGDQTYFTKISDTQSDIQLCAPKIQNCTAYSSEGVYPKLYQICTQCSNGYQLVLFPASGLNTHKGSVCIRAITNCSSNILQALLINGLVQNYLMCDKCDDGYIIAKYTNDVEYGLQCLKAINNCKMHQTEIQGNVYYNRCTLCDEGYAVAMIDVTNQVTMCLKIIENCPVNNLKVEVLKDAQNNYENVFFSCTACDTNFIAHTETISASDYNVACIQIVQNSPILSNIAKGTFPFTFSLASTCTSSQYNNINQYLCLYKEEANCNTYQATPTGSYPFEWLQCSSCSNDMIVSNDQQCVDSVTNCQNGQSTLAGVFPFQYSQCSLCSAGYDLKGGDRICKQQAPSIQIDVLQTIDSQVGSAQQCDITANDSFTLNALICQSVIKNCKVYQYDQMLFQFKCLQCQDQYIISKDSSFCTFKIDNCLVYNDFSSDTPAQCTKCKSNYQIFYNGLRCLKNVPFCKTQTTSSSNIDAFAKCTTCEDGFELASKSGQDYCIRIVENCSSYFALSTASLSYPNYYKNCKTCESGFSYKVEDGSSNIVRCQKGIPNCQTTAQVGAPLQLHEDYHKCTQAENGHLLSSDGLMSYPKILHCPDANQSFSGNLPTPFDYLICSQCDSGYEKKDGGRYCIEKVKRYFVKNTTVDSDLRTTQKVCFIDDQDLEIDINTETYHCYKTIPNCSSYDDKLQQTGGNQPYLAYCKTVESGYQLSSDNYATLPKIPNCATHDNSAFTIDNKVLKCQQCNNDYQLSADETMCIVKTICGYDSAQSEYIYSSNQDGSGYNIHSICDQCTGLYAPVYNKNQKIVACVKNIPNCSFQSTGGSYPLYSNQCLLCDQGYLVDSTGTLCLPIIENCQSLTESLDSYPFKFFFCSSCQNTDTLYKAQVDNSNIFACLMMIQNGTQTLKLSANNIGNYYEVDACDTDYEADADKLSCQQKDIMYKFDTTQTTSVDTTQGGITNCTSTKTDYPKLKQTCVKQIPFCDSYTAVQYYGYTCSSCASGYIKSEDGYICHPKIQHCTTHQEYYLNQPVTCSKCDDLYLLSPSRQLCLRSISNCIKHTMTETPDYSVTLNCETCEAGYEKYLHQANNFYYCLLLIDNCQTYDPSFYLDYPYTYKKCTQCDNGYSPLSISGIIYKCVKLIDHCSSQTKQTSSPYNVTCDSIEAGYSNPSFDAIHFTNYSNYSAISLYTNNDNMPLQYQYYQLTCNDGYENLGTSKAVCSQKSMNCLLDLTTDVSLNNIFNIFSNCTSCVNIGFTNNYGSYCGKNIRNCSNYSSFSISQNVTCTNTAKDYYCKLDLTSNTLATDYKYCITNQPTCSNSDSGTQNLNGTYDICYKVDGDCQSVNFNITAYSVTTKTTYADQYCKADILAQIQLGKTMNQAIFATVGDDLISCTTCDDQSFDSESEQAYCLQKKYNCKEYNLTYQASSISCNANYSQQCCIDIGKDLQNEFDTCNSAVDCPPVVDPQSPPYNYVTKTKTRSCDSIEPTFSNVTVTCDNYAGGINKCEVDMSSYSGDTNDVTPTITSCENTCVVVGYNSGTGKYCSYQYAYCTSYNANANTNVVECTTTSTYLQLMTTTNDLSTFDNSSSCSAIGEQIYSNGKYYVCVSAPLETEDCQINYDVDFACNGSKVFINPYDKLINMTYTQSQSCSNIGDTNSNGHVCVQFGYTCETFSSEFIPMTYSCVATKDCLINIYASLSGQFDNGVCTQCSDNSQLNCINKSIGVQTFTPVITYSTICNNKSTSQRNCVIDLNSAYTTFEQFMLSNCTSCVLNTPITGESKSCVQSTTGCQEYNVFPTAAYSCQTIQAGYLLNKANNEGYPEIDNHDPTLWPLVSDLSSQLICREGYLPSEDNTRCLLMIDFCFNSGDALKGHTYSGTGQDQYLACQQCQDYYIGHQLNNDIIGCSRKIPNCLASSTSGTYPYYYSTCSNCRGGYNKRTTQEIVQCVQEMPNINSMSYSFSTLYPYSYFYFTPSSITNATCETGFTKASYLITTNQYYLFCYPSINNCASPLSPQTLPIPVFHFKCSSCSNNQIISFNGRACFPSSFISTDFSQAANDIQSDLLNGSTCTEPKYRYDDLYPIQTISHCGTYNTSFTSKQATCSQADNGYVTTSNSKRCLPFIENCKTGKTISTSDDPYGVICQECEGNYELIFNGRRCLRKIDMCTEWTIVEGDFPTAYSFCTNCEQGYIPYVNGGLENQFCFKLVDNCIKYDNMVSGASYSYIKCIECQSGFSPVIDSNSQIINCQVSIGHCSTYAQGSSGDGVLYTYCQTCEGGYSKIELGTSPFLYMCYKIANCTTVTFGGYTFNEASAIPKCDSCDSGYSQSTGNIYCQQNYSKYYIIDIASSDTIDTQLTGTEYNSSSICLGNRANTESQFCTRKIQSCSSYEDKTWDDGTIICKQCDSGYVILSNGRCGRAIDNCKVYEDQVGQEIDSYCSICDNGYNLTKNQESNDPADGQFCLKQLNCSDDYNENISFQNIQFSSGSFTYYSFCSQCSNDYYGIIDVTVNQIVQCTRKKHNIDFWRYEGSYPAYIAYPSCQNQTDNNSQNGCTNDGCKSNHTRLQISGSFNYECIPDIAFCSQYDVYNDYGDYYYYYGCNTCATVTGITLEKQPSSNPVICAQKVNDCTAQALLTTSDAIQLKTFFQYFSCSSCDALFLKTNNTLCEKQELIFADVSSDAPSQVSLNNQYSVHAKYEYDNTHCLYKVNNCETYSDIITKSIIECSSCSNGYQKINSYLCYETANIVLHCLTPTSIYNGLSQKFTCQTCEDGYTLSADTTQCLQDIPNCVNGQNVARYDSSGNNYLSCSQCSQGYIQAPIGLATQCLQANVDNCLQYSAANINNKAFTICLTCDYFNNYQKLMDTNNSKCVKTIEHCKTYSVESDIENTKTVNKYKKCSDCESSDYILSSDGSQCLIKSIDNCQDAQANIRGVYPNQTVYCLVCQANYLLSNYPITNCLAFQSNCSLEANNLLIGFFPNQAISCNSCDNTYDIVGTGIQICDQSSDYQIYKCLEYEYNGQYPNYQKTCKTCDVGYQLVTGSVSFCQQQLSNCQEYQYRGVFPNPLLSCKTCNAGYILLPQNDDTLVSTDGHIQTCTLKIDNCELENHKAVVLFTRSFYVCASCDNISQKMDSFGDNYCSKCNSGYQFIMHNSQQCVQLIPNCAVHAVGGVYPLQYYYCTNCQSGYMLISSQAPNYYQCLRKIEHCQDGKMITSTDPPGKTYIYKYLQCQDSGCESGYILTTDKLQCILQEPHCKSYVTGGYTIEGVHPNRFMVCTECEDGYKKTDFNQSCINDIYHCQDAYKLVKGFYPNFYFICYDDLASDKNGCVSGYLPGTKFLTCLRKLPNCNTHTIKGTFPNEILSCSSCDSGFILTNPSNIVQLCTLEYVNCSAYTTMGSYPNYYAVCSACSGSYLKLGLPNPSDDDIKSSAFEGYQFCVNEVPSCDAYSDQLGKYPNYFKACTTCSSSTVITTTQRPFCLNQINNCQTHQIQFESNPFNQQLACQTANSDSIMMNGYPQYSFQKISKCLNDTQFSIRGNKPNLFLTCSKCDTGYSLYENDNNMMCLKDVENCKGGQQVIVTTTLTGGSDIFPNYYTKCNQCLTGYNIVQYGRLCVKPIDNCQTQSLVGNFPNNYYKCTQCNSGYIQISEQLLCLRKINYCQDAKHNQQGYFPNVYFTCGTSPTNDCDSGYTNTTFNLQCLKNIPNCTTNKVMGTFPNEYLECDLCDSGYELTAPGVNAIKQCRKKQSNCAAYTTKGQFRNVYITCTSCTDNSFIQMDPSIEADNIKYCYKKLQYCAVHEFKGQYPNYSLSCSQCDSDKYTLVENDINYKQCIPNIPLCQTTKVNKIFFSAFLQCELCEEGYFATPDSSEQCKKKINNCKLQSNTPTITGKRPSQFVSCPICNDYYTNSQIPRSDDNILCLRKIDYCSDGNSSVQGTTPGSYIQCDDCDSGYTKTLNNRLCLKGVSNCETNQNSLAFGLYPSLLYTCLTCSNNYTISTTQMQCLQNIGNCSTQSEKGLFPNTFYNCSQCQQDYIKIGGIFAQCLLKITNCDLSQNEIIGYGFKSYLRCKQCSSATKRTDDYRKCLPIIDSCALYRYSTKDNTTHICQECDNGKRLSNNACVSGIGNCKTYNTAGDQCQECIDGFVSTTDKLKCLPFIKDCDQYVESTQNQTEHKCQSCKTDLGVTLITLSDQKLCLMKIHQCLTHSYYDNKKLQLKCDNCEANYTLVNQFHCKCTGEYQLTNDKTMCLQLVPFCQTHIYDNTKSTTQFVCSSCNATYASIKGGLKCVPVNDYCQTIDEEISTKDATKCATCKNNNILSTDKRICLPPIDKCQKYIDSNYQSQKLYCQECEADYVTTWDSRKCPQKKQYCKYYSQNSEQSNSLTCIACEKNFSLNEQNDSTPCFCGEGFLLTSDQKKCLQKIANCLTHGNTDNNQTFFYCDSCNADYLLNTSKTQCFKKIGNCGTNVVGEEKITCSSCSSGFRLANYSTLCLKEIDNCTVYDGDESLQVLVCKTCGLNYTPSSIGATCDCPIGYLETLDKQHCLKEIQYCSLHDIKTSTIECSTCEKGRTLQEGSCY